MNRAVTQILTVLVALAVVASGAMFVAAVETTDSTDASNVGAVEASDWADDGSTVVSGFNASSQNRTNVTFAVGNDNATSNFEMTVSHDGVEHLSLSDSHSSFQTVATDADLDNDSTAESDVHAWNFTNDRLETIPADPGENTTITVNITNYNSDDTVNSSVEFNVTLTAGNDHSVRYLADGTTAFDDVDVEEVGASVFSWGTEDADVPDHYVYESNLSVGPSGESTIYLDGDMAENYSMTADDHGGWITSDLEDGDLITGMGVLVDEDLQPVYYGEAGEDVDTDEDVYAVYNQDDDTVTFHNLEEGNQDVIVANHKPGNFEDLGFWDIRAHSAFGFWDASRAY